MALSLLDRGPVYNIWYDVNTNQSLLIPTNEAPSDYKALLGQYKGYPSVEAARAAREVLGAGGGAPPFSGGSFDPLAWIQAPQNRPIVYVVGGLFLLSMLSGRKRLL